MSKIFGAYIEEFSPELDSLEMTFTPSTRSIRKRWSNNRLSAQFVGDYFSAFLPTNEDDLNSDRRIQESRSTVSYVANELLENAMKFSDRTSNFKVRFGVYFLEHDLEQNSDITAVIYVTNSTPPDNAEKFQTFVTELLATDPEEMYVTQVEKSFESDSNASGLGFLTMINDYSAKLGWKFATIKNGSSQIQTVTSMAQITV